MAVNQAQLKLLINCHFDQRDACRDAEGRVKQEQLPRVCHREISKATKEQEV